MRELAFIKDDHIGGSAEKRFARDGKRQSVKLDGTPDRVASVGARSFAISEFAKLSGQGKSLPKSVLVDRILDDFSSQSSLHPSVRENVKNAFKSYIAIKRREDIMVKSSSEALEIADIIIKYLEIYNK